MGYSSRSIDNMVMNMKYETKMLTLQASKEEQLFTIFGNSQQARSDMHGKLQMAYSVI